MREWIEIIVKLIKTASWAIGRKREAKIQDQNSKTECQQAILRKITERSVNLLNL
jgi:hypothetical protein